MLDFHQPEKLETQTRIFAAVLPNTPLILPTTDHQKLQEHLDDCACERRSNTKLLAYVLANKLMNTRPVANLFQRDLVVGGSRVTYAIDDAEPLTGQLTHHVRAGQPGGLIPVASLLGATLIGMRLGQRTPLLFKDGHVGRIRIIDVDGPV